MTLDGEEIGSFSDAKWWRENWKRRKMLGESWKEAGAALRDAGELSRMDFHEALYSYIGVAIGDAISSPDPIVRGLAMLDARLGKRRLRELRLPAGEHPLVQLLFAVRCEAEGINRKSVA